MERTLGKYAFTCNSDQLQIFIIDMYMYNHSDREYVHVTYTLAFFGDVNIGGVVVKCLAYGTAFVSRSKNFNILTEKRNSDAKMLITHKICRG